MSKTALRVLVLVFLSLSMSLAIVATVSAAVCPGGPGPTCIELRVDDPSSSSSILWVSSGRDVGAMAGQKWINDLENVSFDSPAGKLFTSVSIELECQGPATRLHVVQVYFYVAPGQLCEVQFIEPPLYPARPHGAPGVNSRPIPCAPLGSAGLRSSPK